MLAGYKLTLRNNAGSIPIGSLFTLRQHYEASRCCVCEKPFNECLGHLYHVNLPFFIINPALKAHVCDVLSGLCVEIDSCGVPIGCGLPRKACICPSPSPVGLNMEWSIRHDSCDSKSKNAVSILVREIKSTTKVNATSSGGGVDISAMHAFFLERKSKYAYMFIDYFPLITPTAIPKPMDTMTNGSPIYETYVSIINHVTCWGANTRKGTAKPSLHKFFLENQPLRTQIEAVARDITSIMSLKKEKAKTPSPNIPQILSGNAGIIRNYVAKKRERQTARFVLQASWGLKCGVIVLPYQARNMSITEKVTIVNLERVRSMAEQGLVTNILVGERYIHFRPPGEIVVGDSVKRRVQNGDLAILNRNPTLGVGSTHIVEILLSNDPQQMVARVNRNQIKALAGDFDGDQINITVLSRTNYLSATETLLQRNIFGNMFSDVLLYHPYFHCPTAMYWMSTRYRTKEFSVGVHRMLCDVLGQIEDYDPLIYRNFVSLFQSFLPETFSYKGESLVIERGKWISGNIVDKNLLGGGSITCALYKRYGPKVAHRFMNGVTMSADVFSKTIIVMTLDVDDFFVPSLAKIKDIAREVNAEIQSIDRHIDAAGGIGDNVAEDRIKALGTTFFERSAQEYRKADTRMSVIFQSGGRGHTDNGVMISGAVGQYYSNGTKRPDFRGAHFTKTGEPSARGFISTNYCALRAFDLLVILASCRVAVASSKLAVPKHGDTQRIMELFFDSHVSYGGLVVSQNRVVCFGLTESDGKRAQFDMADIFEEIQ